MRIFNKLKTFVANNSYEVSLRGRVSLEEDFQEIFEDISNLLSKKYLPKIVFDITDVEFLYPSAVLLLIALKDFLEKIDVTVSFKFKENEMLHRYLVYSESNQILGIPNLTKEFNSNKFFEGEVFPLEVINGSVSFSKTSELVDLLTKKQPMSPGFEGYLSDSLDEIFTNIDYHSGCSKCYVLAQVYPTSKRIRLAIMDNGVGIKSHMTKRPYNEMHGAFRQEVSRSMFDLMKKEHSGYAIREASRSCVSATDYTKNSGAGLHFLKRDICSETDGKLYVMSGDGCVAWKCGNEQPDEFCKLPYRIDGTLLSLVMNYDEYKIVDSI